MGIGVISVVRKAPLEWPGGREGTNSAEVWGQQGQTRQRGARLGAISREV